MAAKDKLDRASDEAQGRANEQREKASEAAEDRLEQAQEGAEGARAGAESAVQAATETIKSAAKDGSQGMLKTVVGAARDAATEVLEREARAGAKQAAEYLAQKAPELAQRRLGEAGGGGPAAQAALNFGKAKLEDAGGAKALMSAAGGAVKGAGGAVKGVVDKVKPGGGGGEKRTRRLPVMASIDIAVPIDTAYNQWTQFEDAPEYMQRITNVDQVDDAHLKVDAKIWGIKRQWELEITDQRPNERIVWQTTQGTKHSGVVSFHALDDELTRVMVLLDFPPEGFNEKLASGLRLVQRATQADLKRFRRFVEMREDETGAWRGSIEEGEVVEGGEEDEERREDREPEDEGVAEPEAREAEEEPEEGEEEYEDEGEEEPEAEQEPEEEAEEEGEEPEAEAEEEPEAEAEEEPEAEAEEEPEAEAEPEEEEEEEAPRPRRQVRRRAPASTGTRRKRSAAR